MTGLRQIVDDWLDDERLGSPLDNVDITECEDAEDLCLTLWELIEAINEDDDGISDANGNTVFINYSTSSVSMYVHGEELVIDEFTALFTDSIGLLDSIMERESFEFAYDSGLAVEYSAGDSVTVTVPSRQLEAVETYFDNLLEYAGLNVPLVMVEGD